MDSYTFCVALGPEEANRQLRLHWKKWVTEDHIRFLSENGVHHVRIPVADWMFVPYAPYEGCFDGAIEELDRVLGLLRKYGMTALLDMHCVKDSANGLDNGGHSMHIQWEESPDTSGIATWDHYNYKTAHWMGPFNLTSLKYTLPHPNYENLNHTMRAYEILIEKYASDPAVFGMVSIEIAISNFQII